MTMLDENGKRIIFKDKKSLRFKFNKKTEKTKSKKLNTDKE